ncbi:MAG: RNA polymerase sigma factor [Planctomycetota bacterium]
MRASGLPPQVILSGLDENDDDLLRRAAARDPEALELLLVQYLPELRAFVRARIGRDLAAKETPEDIVQSACREVLANVSEFRGGGRTGFRAWLMLAASRKIVDRARFWSRSSRDTGTRDATLDVAIHDEMTSLASLLTPSRVAMGREDVQRFEAAFERLTPESREVITASKLLGLSHADIALATGRSEGAVRVLLHRALARLGRLLEESGSA